MVYGQPVISRETRRLLVTILVSVTALWVLARIRFQERPVPSTPVPNVLAQLRPVSSYTDLARIVADIRPAILAAVSASAGGGAALRIRDDAAVTLAPGPADTLVALDRATGLAIVRHENGDVPGLMPWVPRLLDYPRYLVAADVAGEHVALRPIFAGGLFPSSSPLWSGELWTLPHSAAVAPGTFLFTTEGAFAGLCVTHGDGTAIVPATLLLGALDRLQQQSGEAGRLGITIQPLQPAIAKATGATTGVVISAIDPAGPAAGTLTVTEVIEAVNGQEMTTPDHWRVRAARVNAGDVLTLRVRGHESVRDVQVTAAPYSALGEPSDVASPGMTLRAIPKIGVEVLSVQPGSRAARAALRAGDAITFADGQPSPTPAQVMRAWASLPAGGSLLVAVTRGSDHSVVAIEK
jgi:PDZ domain